MRVLAVVHGELVGPELFGEIIRERGHELSVWEIARGGPLPGAADAVLVLGGHMNVGEEAANPWLEREYELLRGWVAAETPLLGICLGAQTLAHALGARVARAPAPRAGFYELSLTEAGRRDALLGGLPPRFEALFANAYAFDLPDGATELAASAGRPQAYRAGRHAWGLAFHPEARLGQVLAWWSDGRELPRPLETLEGELAAGMEAWPRLGRAICDAFLEAAAADAAKGEPSRGAGAGGRGRRPARPSGAC